MLQTLTRPYDRIISLISGGFIDLSLLFVRMTLVSIFWRSGRTKEGSWLTVGENTIYQFGDDPFNKVPLLTSNWQRILPPMPACPTYLAGVRMFTFPQYLAGHAS
jgi:hypothetical protein